MNYDKDLVVILAPLEWHQDTVRRLQGKLGERGLDGIWITDRWNIIYYTGLFHSTTERPFSCFIPTNELAVYWYHPGLDLEMVRSWWSTEADYYYDYPPSEEGYPDQGKVVTGPPVDLIEWALKGSEVAASPTRKLASARLPPSGPSNA